MTCFVYAILIGGRVYIGSSSNVKKRIAFHLWQLRNNRHSNEILQRSYIKHGVFLFTTVEECSKEGRFCVEQKWIDRFIDTGRSMNIARDATVSIKQFMTPEVRAKISAANKGKEISAEARAKISKSLVGYYKSDEGAKLKIIQSGRMKGKKRSEEFSRAISEKLRGRKRPKEVCEKISDALTGKIVGQATRNKISNSLRGRDYGEQWREKQRALSEKRRGIRPSDATIGAAKIANTKIKVRADLGDGTCFSGSIPDLSRECGIKEATLRLWHRNGSHCVGGVMFLPVESIGRSKGWTLYTPRSLA